MANGAARTDLVSKDLAELLAQNNLHKQFDAQDEERAVILRRRIERAKVDWAADNPDKALPPVYDEQYHNFLNKYVQEKFTKDVKNAFLFTTQAGVDLLDRLFRFEYFMGLTPTPNSLLMKVFNVTSRARREAGTYGHVSLFYIPIGDRHSCSPTTMQAARARTSPRLQFKLLTKRVNHRSGFVSSATY